MTHGFKLVAAVMAFVLLASGLSVFAACLRGDAATISKCCGPHCSMKMKAHSADIAFQMNPEGTSCCNISSGIPLPTPAPQVPSHRWLGTQILVAVEPNASALLVPKTELCDEASPSKTALPRSVLCIFLI